MRRLLPRSPLSRLAAALLVVSLAMVGAGLWGPDGGRVVTGRPAPSDAAAASPLPHTVGDEPPPGYRSRRAAPVRLLVPSLRIDAPVVPIALSSDAVLTPPSDYRTVGWWDGSAEPGAHAGQTVITGHTVHTGGGAMDRLPDLEPGKHLAVRTTKGTQHYLVQGTAALTHEELATYALNLFAQDRGEGRLILVTCTNWNGAFYERNEVVLAVRTTWHPNRAAGAQRTG